MKVLHDRIAFVTAMVGAVVHDCRDLDARESRRGSVVRPEFLHTAMGQPIAMLLLIASLPGWIGIILAGSLGLPIEPEAVFFVEFFLAQIFIYWFLGKSHFDWLAEVEAQERSRLGELIR
jgi:hypothetical protein